MDLRQDYLEWAGRLRDRGEFQDSNDVLEELARIDPDNLSPCFHMMGLNHLSLGDRERARQILRLALLISQRDVRSMIALGRIAEDSIEAEQLLKKALTLEPNNTTALYNLGRLNIEQGKPRIAVYFLDKAAMLTKGGDADVQAALGIAEYSIDRLKAITDTKKALLLDPSHEEARITLDRLLATPEGAEYLSSRRRTIFSKLTPEAVSEKGYVRALYSAAAVFLGENFGREYDKVLVVDTRTAVSLMMVENPKEDTPSSEISTHTFSFSYTNLPKLLLGGRPEVEALKGPFGRLCVLPANQYVLRELRSLDRDDIRIVDEPQELREPNRREQDLTQRVITN